MTDRERISRDLYARRWAGYWPYDAMPKWLRPGWHHTAPVDKLVPELRDMLTVVGAL